MLPEPSLLALPQDLCLKILSYLPAKALSNVSQTSTFLHKLATSEQLFQLHHTRHHPTPSPRTVPWREVHRRAVGIRRAPSYESFTSPKRIVPICEAADGIIIHFPERECLYGLPYGWSLKLGFLNGAPRGVCLGESIVFVDESNIQGRTTCCHVVEARTGNLTSYEIPGHEAALAPFPGRDEYILPAESFHSVIYYTGQFRLFNLTTRQTRTLLMTEYLLLGESSKPLVEGYAETTSSEVRIYTLAGEMLTTLPLCPDEKLLSVCTNNDNTCFTARIERPQAVVALTKTRAGDLWTHIHPIHGVPPRIHMFYNGQKTLLLPSEGSPRMTIIQTGIVGRLHTIRAARVRGAPFDWGGVSFGGDVVVLVAKQLGVISFFDVRTGSCIRSVRFSMGMLDDVLFINGAWIVGWRRDGCFFECWRYGVGPIFENAKDIFGFQ